MTYWDKGREWDAEPQQETKMTDDTARVEACLKWLDEYERELDRLEVSPNGDDYNRLMSGAVSILRDGIVPRLRIPAAGR